MVQIIVLLLRMRQLNAKRVRVLDGKWIHSYVNNLLSKLRVSKDKSKYLASS